MSKSIIRELIDSNATALKDAAARAGGKLLLDAILGDPTLKERILVAEGLGALAGLLDENGTPGKILRPVAVGALSTTVDDVVHAFITASAEPGSDIKLALTTEEYTKQRELDVVFSSAADGQVSMELPTPEKAWVITPGGGVVKPSDDFGMSMADAVASAMTSKSSDGGSSSTDTTTAKSSGTEAHKCARCSKPAKKKDLKEWKPIKDVLPSVEKEVTPFIGTNICGTCRKDLNQSIDKAHSNERRSSAILEKLESNKASTERLSGELAEYKATIESVAALGDKAPAPMQALAKDAEAKIVTITNNITKIAEDTEKLEKEYNSISAPAATTEEAGVEKSSEL